MSDIFGGEDIPDFEQGPEPVEVEREIEREPVARVEREEPVESVPEPEIGERSTVPLAALNEARAQARMAQAEAQQVKQFLESMKPDIDEWREWKKSQQQTQEEQQFNSDPLGMIQRQLKELDQRVSGKDNQAQQEVQQAQVFASISSQVQEFKKTAPDYDAALQHVLEARKQELMAMGTAEHEAQQWIAQEAQQIAVNALRSGQNPGKVVYELAKLRGYNAKRTAEKLDTIGKGQDASKSLAGTSGGADRGVSLTEVDNMSDEDFDKWWAKNIRPTAR